MRVVMTGFAKNKIRETARYIQSEFGKKYRDMFLYKYYIFFLQRYEELGERQKKSPCNAFCLPRNAYLCRRILNTINQNINYYD